MAQSIKKKKDHKIQQETHFKFNTGKLKANPMQTLIQKKRKWRHQYLTKKILEERKLPETEEH